ncbi:MAG TPA: tRNA (cytidine(34)-2'-O)-methyltransferase [Vampirovibrionales bacterium]
MLNIVLYQPEIPQNTGNVGRLCVCNNWTLHLVKPLGYELEDKYLKRSGMDYWQHLNLVVHENWEACLKYLKEQNFYYLTTKVQKPYWNASFKEGDALVFGPETSGLPKEILEANKENCLTIPMTSEHKRSLNLATSVGIVSYEAARQLFVNKL